MEAASERMKGEGSSSEAHSDSQNNRHKNA